MRLGAAAAAHQTRDSFVWINSMIHDDRRAARSDNLLQRSFASLASTKVCER